jgi:hypothetical protein
MSRDRSAHVLRGDIFGYFFRRSITGRRLPEKNVCRSCNRWRGLRDHIRVGAISESEAAQRVQSWIAHAEHAIPGACATSSFPGGKADPRSIGTDFLASSAVPPAAAYSLDIGSMPPRIAR